MDRVRQRSRNAIAAQLLPKNQSPTNYYYGEIVLYHALYYHYAIHYVCHTDYTDDHAFYIYSVHDAIYYDGHDFTGESGCG